MKKKVLVVYFSQTGQLSRVVKSLIAPLLDNNTDVMLENVQPEEKYPFPWSIYKFFDVFPESVYLDPPKIKPLSIDPEEDFDLVIIAYTVWFLSPSLPITGFLKSNEARLLLKDKPVVTVIACRNMWLMAQEKMKAMINDLGGQLIDNVVLVDRGNSFLTFITTPRWMLTGKRNKFLFFPTAGINHNDIENCSRFGNAIVDALSKDKEQEQKSILQGLAAVSVNHKLIPSEKLAHRSFLIWGKIIRLFGSQSSKKRYFIITFYMIFLVLLIVTVVPISMLFRSILFKFKKESLLKEKAYFEKPSGSSSDHFQQSGDL